MCKDHEQLLLYIYHVLIKYPYKYVCHKSFHIKYDSTSISKQSKSKYELLLLYVQSVIISKCLVVYDLSRS